MTKAAPPFFNGTETMGTRLLAVGFAAALAFLLQAAPETLAQLSVSFWQAGRAAGARRVLEPAPSSSEGPGAPSRGEKYGQGSAR